MIRLELKTSVYEMTVTVVSTVTGCDVTTVQQHYKGSTSTPPRVARLSQIREASLVALRKFPKIYACSHVSIVRLVIILVSTDFHSHSSPLYNMTRVQQAKTLMNVATDRHARNARFRFFSFYFFLFFLFAYVSYFSRFCFFASTKNLKRIDKKTKSINEKIINKETIFSNNKKNTKKFNYINTNLVKKKKKSKKGKKKPPRDTSPRRLKKCFFFKN